MDSAIAALLGALIGAIASIGAMLVQERFRARREWLRMAIDLGMKDWQMRNERAKLEGGSVWPVDHFVYHHSRILRALAGGKLTAEFLRQLNREEEVLGQTILGEGKHQ